MYQNFRSARGCPVSIIGAGIAGTWQALRWQRPATPSPSMSATTPRCASHQPHGRRHARAVVRGRGRGTGHHPARRPLARAVARAFPRHPVQRLAGGGASARPRRFRPLRAADHRPPAARRAGHCANSNRRWKAVSATALFFPDEGHVEPRRVLPQLHERLDAAGGTIKFDSDARRRTTSTAS